MNAGALLLLKSCFATQTQYNGKHSLTLVSVHRTRGGRTHNAFLVATNDEYGTRVHDVTAAVASVLGVEYDKKSGGIPASAPWVCVHQVNKLAEALGIEIEHDTI